MRINAKPEVNVSLELQICIFYTADREFTWDVKISKQVASN